MIVELSERYSSALARYLETVNKESDGRPYPQEQLTPTFFVECALREFWRANQHDSPDLIAYLTVTEVRRG